MITTKCNMKCSHCCNYEENQKDMSYDLFKNILYKWGDNLQKINKRICIGGGEPTIHPNFWEIIDYTKKYGHPWLATNGKRTEDALELCEMAKKGYLSVCLSIDKWHEPIDKKVIDSFMNGLVEKFNKKGIKTGYKSTSKKDKRSIQIITEKTLYMSGKSVKGSKSCHCKRMRIFPDGIIKLCACKESPVIGDVKSGIMEIYDRIPLVGKCYRDYLKFRT